MFCMVDRFSQLIKASILSLSLLALFSGVCYGQQSGQTTVLISTNVKSAPSGPVIPLTGGSQSSVSGDGRTVAYTVTSNSRPPAVFRDPTVLSTPGTILSLSNIDGTAKEGRQTSQNVNGSMIAFTSSNLTSNGGGVFLFTGQNNPITTVSNSITGTSDSPFISRDGKFIVFVSKASDITNDSPIDGTPNIYLYDGSSVTLISRQSNGHAFSTPCTSPAISENGTVIVFESNGRLFVKKQQTDIPSDQINMSIQGRVSSPTISADGSTVACISTLPNPGNVNVINLNAPNFPILGRFNVNTNSRPALSRTGQFLAVDSLMKLAPTDLNNFMDVYLYSVSQTASLPTLVSLTADGMNATFGDSTAPSINDDASVIAFTSDASLTPDAGATTNVFARLSASGGIGGGVGSIQTGPVCIGRGRALTTDTIEISWGFGAHNDQLRGYEVEVMKLEGSQYKSLAKVPGDGKALYTDIGLTPNTVYTYRLLVSDPKGNAYSLDFTTKTKKVKKH